MNKIQNQVCKRCVMDNSAVGINFDEEGICGYCSEFLQRSGQILNKNPSLRKKELDFLITKVKANGVGKSYDCIIGVSGGVDSSWVLVQAVKLGLRPLAVHMDNGWNSELAQNNIENLVRGLGVDLYTHVIDWDEYRKLMQAFFDADVIDVELLYDNAMFSVNYEQAAKHGLKYILGGMNQATEGMRIPTNWNWFKFDKRNIRAIGKRFGNVKIKTFPAIGTIDYVLFEFLRGIRWVPFLDFLEFNKSEALESMQKDYGYKPYPFKHYESIFTRFYQGYILPEKFGVDKRRLHLGTLVISGQMTREAAILGLKGIPYQSESALEEDKKYFLKKMGWSTTQLIQYINRPERPHSDYPSEKPFWLNLVKLYNFIPWFKGLKL